MATIHVSEAEAAKDIASLIDLVREGAEVAIERDDKVVAVLRDPADSEFKPRTLTESLAMAEALDRERGYPLEMDEDYAADMREIIANRKNWNSPYWE
jgi:antitoxin (DNA-binding transcriptional repressor) of toxin-antitoxin stability system